MYSISRLSPDVRRKSTGNITNGTNSDNSDPLSSSNGRPPLARYSSDSKRDLVTGVVRPSNIIDDDDEDDIPPPPFERLKPPAGALRKLPPKIPQRLTLKNVSSSSSSAAYQQQETHQRSRSERIASAGLLIIDDDDSSLGFNAVTKTLAEVDELAYDAVTRAKAIWESWIVNRSSGSEMDTDEDDESHYMKECNQSENNGAAGDDGANGEYAKYEQDRGGGGGGGTNESSNGSGHIGNGVWGNGSDGGNIDSTAYGNQGLSRKRRRKPLEAAAGKHQAAEEVVAGAGVGAAQLHLVSGEADVTAKDVTKKEGPNSNGEAGRDSRAVAMSSPPPPPFPSLSAKAQDDLPWYSKLIARISSKEDLLAGVKEKGEGEGGGEGEGRAETDNVRATRATSAVAVAALGAVNTGSIINEGGTHGIDDDGGDVVNGDDDDDDDGVGKSARNSLLANGTTTSRDLKQTSEHQNGNGDDNFDDGVDGGETAWFGTAGGDDKGRPAGHYSDDYDLLELHRLVYDCADDDREARSKLAKAVLLRPRGLDVIDHHGNTPLLLAMKKKRLSAAHVLVAGGAQLEGYSGDKSTFRVIDEAILTGNEELVTDIYGRIQKAGWISWEAKVQGLLHLLEDMPDFHLVMDWKFDANNLLSPLVKAIAPSDSYSIWKRGSYLRVDCSITGFSRRLRTQRGSISLLLTGKDSEEVEPGCLLKLDHGKKKIYRVLRRLEAPTRGELRRVARRLINGGKKLKGVSTYNWSSSELNFEPFVDKKGKQKAGVVFGKTGGVESVWSCRRFVITGDVRLEKFEKSPIEHQIIPYLPADVYFDATSDMDIVDKGVMCEVEAAREAAGLNTIFNWPGSARRRSNSFFSTNNGYFGGSMDGGAGTPTHGGGATADGNMDGITTGNAGSSSFADMLSSMGWGSRSATPRASGTVGGPSGSTLNTPRTTTVPAGVLSGFSSQPRSSSLSSLGQSMSSQQQQQQQLDQEGGGDGESGGDGSGPTHPLTLPRRSLSVPRPPPSIIHRELSTPIASSTQRTFDSSPSPRRPPPLTHSAAVSAEKKTRSFEKTVRTDLWMTKEFPLTIMQLRSILEVLSMQDEVLKKLKDVLATEGVQEAGFPAKVCLPVYMGCSCVVMFTECTMGPQDKSLFDIPLDYALSKRMEKAGLANGLVERKRKKEDEEEASDDEEDYEEEEDENDHQGPIAAAVEKAAKEAHGVAVAVALPESKKIG